MLEHLWHRYYDPGTMRFLTVDPAALLEAWRYVYCADDPIGQVDASGLAWYHVFVPWSDQNPIAIDAYNGGWNSRVTMALNPIYHAINGYYNEVQASLKGCSWWNSFKYGLEGVAGVLGTVSLVTPAPKPVPELSLVQRFPSRLTGYSSHALNQAISRQGTGVSPAAILDAWRNPIGITWQAGGKFMVKGADATIIVNGEGRIVTTWANSSRGYRIRP